MGDEKHEVTTEVVSLCLPHPAVFKGTDMRIGDKAKRDVVVFTATYHGDAHRKPAETGRAPYPQFCGPVGGVSVYVVDMDYEDGERTTC